MPCQRATLAAGRPEAPRTTKDTGRRQPAAPEARNPTGNATRACNLLQFTTILKSRYRYDTPQPENRYTHKSIAAQSFCGVSESFSKKPNPFSIPGRVATQSSPGKTHKIPV
jgi:hypothetical protein